MLAQPSGLHPRLPDGRAAAQGLLFGHLQVETKLLFHVAIAVCECSPDPETPFPQPSFHFASSKSNVCMMDAIRVHSAFSVSSRRRPAAVML